MIENIKKKKLNLFNDLNIISINKFYIIIN